MPRLVVDITFKRKIDAREIVKKVLPRMDIVRIFASETILSLTISIGTPVVSQSLIEELLNMFDDVESIEIRIKY